MRRAARLVAQAKVNLLLHVIAREAGGYHQLETLLQRIELGDGVTVRVGMTTRAVTCTGADCGPPERNLAYRAAVAYADATGWPAGFEIEIEKRIPVGGGLGGGSADAGAVLRALDALAPGPVGEAKLLGIAATLGADVPFLTATAPLALAWGRGERMLELPALPTRTVLLGLFDAGVRTPEAFRWLAEIRGDAPAKPRLLRRDALSSWAGVASIAANDFESVVLPRRPDVAAVLAHLTTPGGVARMSGSGATVFAVIDAAYTESTLGIDLGPMRRWRPVPTRTVSQVVPVEIFE